MFDTKELLEMLRGINNVNNIRDLNKEQKLSLCDYIVQFLQNSVKKMQLLICDEYSVLYYLCKDTANLKTLTIKVNSEDNFSALDTSLTLLTGRLEELGVSTRCETENNDGVLKYKWYTDKGVLAFTLILYVGSIGIYYRPLQVGNLSVCVQSVEAVVGDLIYKVLVNKDFNSTDALQKLYLVTNSHNVYVEFLKQYLEEMELDLSGMDESVIGIYLQDRTYTVKEEICEYVQRFKLFEESLNKEDITIWYSEQREFE